VAFEGSVEKRHVPTLPARRQRRMRKQKRTRREDENKKEKEKNVDNQE
jgi:hypothetical protein